MYFIAALSRSIPEALNDFVHRGSLLNTTAELCEVGGCLRNCQEMGKRGIAPQALRKNLGKVCHFPPPSLHPASPLIYRLQLTLLDVRNVN